MRPLVDDLRVGHLLPDDSEEDAQRILDTSDFGTETTCAAPHD